MDRFPDALYSELELDIINDTKQSAIAIYAKRELLRSIFSKFVRDVRPDADTVALQKFIAANKRCMDFKLDPQSMFDEYLISEVQYELRSLTAPDDFSSFGFGPGATNGTRNANLASKLDSEWTCTSMWVFGQFIQAARLSTGLMALANEKPKRRIVPGSKLCFVPKKDTESRVIACEPLLNMALQKSVEFYLTDWLKKSFQLDLTNQQAWNRLMARIGSEDGSYATIDLSSASDSVSIELCRSILPPCMYQCLQMIRSPVTTLPNGAELELHMISSMGNATTFPLETIIFAALVRAVYRLSGHDYDYAVFGDDIIVKTELANLVLRGLSLFGFTINKDKTFLAGSFRESCGGDYMSGTNVRPVYIRSLSSVPDLCSALNRLVVWSCRHDVFLPNTVEMLCKEIQRRGGAPAIPLDENVDAGVYMWHNRGHGKYKALRPIPMRDSIGKYSPDALYICGLFGTLRDGVLLRRSYGAPKYKWVSQTTPNWNKLGFAKPQFEDAPVFDKVIQFEDLSALQLRDYYFLYNLVTG